MASRKRKNHRDFKSRSRAAKRGWETRRKKQAIEKGLQGTRPRKVKTRRPTRRELEVRLKQAEEALEKARIKRELQEYRETLAGDPDYLREVIAERLRDAYEGSDDPHERAVALKEAIQYLNLEMMEFDLEPYDDVGELWALAHEEGISP